jgi:membrane fusion protein
VSTTPLFRQQALDAQQAQYLGSVRIGRNPGFAAVAGVALLLAAALVSFAAWGQIARKARVPGLLVPLLGSLQLSTAAAGTLAERRVAEGDAVQAGQVLFVIATDRNGGDGPTAALVGASLVQRRGTLEAERALRETASRQRTQALAERIRALDSERLRAEQEALLVERRVALAAKSTERYRQLAGEGFVSELQAQAKQEELIDLEQRSQASQRGVAALAREQQALRVELQGTATQLQTELAQIDRNLAMLGQEATENDARRSLVVTAPAPGMVTALHLPRGAAVQAGQVLATLVPQGAEAAQAGQQLEAQLYAPSRTAGFVQVGQAVWLRYAAFPYQKFGMARGTVSSVSRTPVNPQELPSGQAQSLLAAAQANEPLYRIKVALVSEGVEAFGQMQALKPGMTLEADVVQERRAVWEWLLEPVIAARQRVKVLSANPNKAGLGG